MIRPSGRKLKQNAPVEPFGDRLDVVRGRLRRPRRARLSEPLGNRRVAVGRGAAVFGLGGPGACAGGRGIARTGCACTALDHARRHAAHVNARLKRIRPSF